MLRTRLTVRPPRAGTRRLMEKFGDRLVCVRYRYDDERHIRLKTIELIIAEVPWPRAKEEPPICPCCKKPHDPKDS